MLPSGPIEDARARGGAQASGAQYPVCVRKLTPRYAVGLAILAALVAIWAAVSISELEDRVEARFQGRLFAVPSRVYSRPLELRIGVDVERTRVRERLERMGYVDALAGKRALRPGEFRQTPGSFEVYRRASRLPDRNDPATLFSLRLAGTRVTAVRDQAGELLASASLEPEIIAQFHGVERADRRLEALADVPPVLVDAIIAVEDQSFFEHNGIHLWRIAGAMLANVRAGRVVQGGSTLTQQLAKNFYLTRERTLARKATEALMALLLERNHTKREILEAYLNEVYMGQRGSVAIHGVGEASQHYFGKQVGELTLPEAALLAGLIKGPNLYSPYKHPESARKRRDLVLSVLREQEKIGREEYESALIADLGVRDVYVDEHVAPYFVEALRQDLSDRYGEEILQSEGMAIYSTLDAELQRAANAAVAKQLERLEKDYPKLRRPGSPLQAAVVALAPRSGEILALVGGRDYKLSQFNRASQALRQPGSVFKPIVLLTAVSRRAGEPTFTLLSKLEDDPFTVKLPTGTWQPVNYDGEYRGTVTVRDAIEQSMNVPVAKLGIAVGPDHIVETARRLGITSPLLAVPSVSLGAFEVTVLEAARAYAALAAAGSLPVLRSYTAVVHADGRVLEEQPVEAQTVFDPAEVYLVTSALEGVVDRGTGAALRSLGFEGDIAGKTGTSSDFRDAWFIGYTPDIVIAVWVGFDDAQSVRVAGSVAALPIFADVLEVARGKAPAAEFSVPTGVETIEVDVDSGLRAGFLCGGTSEVFLLGTAPEGACGIFRDLGTEVAQQPDAKGRPPPARRNPVRRALDTVFGWFGRGR
jgi:penicillin-binding protein 1B